VSPAARTANIAVVMITIDRSPKPNYLPQTIANLDRSGVFDSPHLHSFHLTMGHPRKHIVDPKYRMAANRVLHYRECVSLRNPPCKTRWLPRENAGQALIWGSRMGVAEWVLFLEDDIDVCANFLESVSGWLDKHSFVDGNGYGNIYSFASPVNPSALGLFERWTYPDPRNFYGTQAFAVNPRTANYLGHLLTYNYGLVHHPDGTLFSPAEYDLAIGSYAHATDRSIVCSVPSFVQHIGKESSLSDRSECHTFPSWPGRGWSYR